MDYEKLKDILMILVAAYGAGLSTYIFLTNKPKYELIYKMIVFATPSPEKGVKFVPREFVSITVVNTGRVPIYIGKYGFIDENKKFLNVEVVDASLVRENSNVQVRPESDKTIEFASTNEHIPLITDDRQIKPFATAIVFFYADSLLNAISRSGTNRVSVYAECGNTRKIKRIDQVELSELGWLKRLAKQG